jgi:hypothetical protein
LAELQVGITGMQNGLTRRSAMLVRRCDRLLREGNAGARTTGIETHPWRLAIGWPLYAGGERGVPAVEIAAAPHSIVINSPDSHWFAPYSNSRICSSSQLRRCPPDAMWQSKEALIFLRHG